MYFIYILKMNDVPFYAGMTRNPVNRYTCHVHSVVPLMEDFQYYHYAKHKIIAKMEIVDVKYSENTAALAEFKLIKKLTQEGFVLLNYGHNSDIRNRIPFNYKIRKPSWDKQMKQYYSPGGRREMLDNHRVEIKNQITNLCKKSQSKNMRPLPA